RALLPGAGRAGAALRGHRTGPVDRQGTGGAARGRAACQLHSGRGHGDDRIAADKRSGNQGGGNCGRHAPPSGTGAAANAHMARRRKKKSSMTAASFAHLPMQVGGVALVHAGRAALWVIARYMRSPLTNSAILALVVTTAMAGSNALYGQRHAHPSPLFGPSVASEQAAVEPVIPAVRPEGLGVAVTAPQAVEAPALVDTTPGPIGNADVFEVQRKLEMLKLFSGKIDGYYGPQTARAIRKFEELQGLKATGELTPAIVEKIKTAPLSAADPVAKPTPAPAVTVNLPKLDAPKAEDTLPAAKPAAAADAPVEPQTLAALAAPAPLELTTGSIGKPQERPGATVLGRPLPDSPEAALEMAADTAGEAIETIISGVQSVAMNNPGKASSFAAGEQKLTATGIVAEASPDNPQVGVPLRIDEEPQK